MNRSLCVVILGVAQCLAASSPVAGQLRDSMLTPKLAVAKGEGESESVAYVLQSKTGSVMRLSEAELSSGAGELQFVCETPATHVADVQVMHDGQQLLIACDQPPRLIHQPLNGKTPTSSPLPAAPARLALSNAGEDKQLVCVSLPTARCVWIGRRDAQSDQWQGEEVELGFAPGEILALEDSTFVVADAYGNRVSIVDAEAGHKVKHWTMSGYHLAGMALDAESQTLLISHQVLSSNARTEKDDLRWGNLIQNNIAAIPLQLLSKSKTRLNPDTIYRLGDFGHGSADPAGLVAAEDRIAVAVMGTDEVGIYYKAKRQASYVAVGHAPDRLVKFGADRLLCSHRFDSRIAVLHWQGDKPRVERMIGEPPKIDTAQLRGELAFYSGKLSPEGWMSCNSCHVEGRSPDLLVDTLGDGTFDSPKKIPSLDNVAHTGPWAWHGGQMALADQVSKTLTSTMHTPNEFDESTALSRATIVEDLVAYLSAIPSSPSRMQRTNSDVGKGPASDDRLFAGEALFQQHCAKCHDPEQHFTTARSYDVGINDERGQKLFNPPSLIGVSERARFMHDGRYATLSEVIMRHPQPNAKLTPEETTELLAYLQSL